MANYADTDKSSISRKRFIEQITNAFFFFQQRKSYITRTTNLSLLCPVTNATNSVCKKRSYLVLRIFRNCKISENCISLRALKNLKPAVKGKKKKALVKNNSEYNNISLTVTVIHEINIGSIQNVKYL